MCITLTAAVEGIAGEDIARVAGADVRPICVSTIMLTVMTTFITLMNIYRKAMYIILYTTTNVGS